MIYQELEKRSDQHISVYLSYLEIYQEVAYDLLNPAARSTIPIAPFARVRLHILKHVFANAFKEFLDPYVL